MSESDNTHSPPKKKRGDPSKWKRNLIKEARIKGTEHVNYKMQNVAAKEPGPINCCKTNCLEFFSEADRPQIFNNFYSLGSKDEKDIYIQGLIDVYPVERKRARKAEGARENSFSFKYNLSIHGMKQTILQKNAVSDETNSKNVPRNEKAYFTISKYHELNFSKNKKGEIKVKPFIQGFQVQTFQLGQPGKTHVPQPTKKAYPTGKVSIKKAKLDDLKKLQKFIPDDFLFFYRDVLLWPSTLVEDDDSD